MNLSTERCVEIMRELSPVIDKALRSTGLYIGAALFSGGLEPNDRLSDGGK